MKHNHLLWPLVLAALMWLMPGRASAQLGSSYRFETGVDAEAWIDLSEANATQIINGGAGDYGTSALQNIGFGFVFGSQSYTQFSVNTDATVRLGSTPVGTDGYNTPLASWNITTNMPKILAMGCDGFMGDQGYCKYAVVGDEGERTLVIEIATSTYAEGNGNNSIAPRMMQVQLGEDNSIRLVYGSAPTTAHTYTLQIGMAALATDLVLINASDHTAQFLGEGTEVASASGAWPEEGRYYALLFDENVCLPPAAPTVEVSDDGTADISWTTTGADASYILSIPALGVEEELTTNSYSLSGLGSAASYEGTLQTICQSDSVSRPTAFSFATACGVVNSLPWSNNFNAYSANYNGDFQSTTIPCWNYLGGGSITLYKGSYRYGSSGYSVQFYPNNDPNPGVLVMPEFDEEISNLYLTFLTRPEGTTNTSSGTLEVGYVASATMASSFVSLAQYAANDFLVGGSIEWTMIDALFTGAPEGARMAFRYNPGQNSGWYWYLDNVTVSTIPDCSRPASVAISDITTTGATVTINDPDDQGDYVLYLDGGGMHDIIGVSGTEEVLTGLVPGTRYSVQVATLCSDNLPTIMRASASFFTDCDILTHSQLPFEEGFDDYPASMSAQNVINPCERAMSFYPSYEQYPYVYSGGRNGNYLYFIPGLGVANAQYLVLPAIEDVSQLAISMWVMTGTSYPQIDLGVMTDPDDVSTFELVQTLGTQVFGQWANLTASLGSYEGEGNHIALRLRCEQYGGYYVEIDDISVVVDNCPQPYGLTASDFTLEGGATLQWTMPEGVESVRLSVSGVVQDEVVEGNSYTIESGLGGLTNYNATLTSLCEEGGTSFDYQATFSTPLSTLPYTQDFETYFNQDSPMPGWRKLGDGYIDQSTTSYMSHGYTLRFYGSPISNDIMLLPLTPVDISGLSLQFEHVPEGTSSGTFSVGYMTDADDLSSFVPVQSWTPADFNPSTVPHDEFITFAGAPSGARMAFHYSSPNNWYWYVDNVEINYASCIAPGQFALAELDPTSALFTWQGIDDVEGYSLTLPGEAEPLVLTDTFYLLENLTPDQDYTVSIATVCSADEPLSRTLSISFRTPCTLMGTDELPYSENFESYNTYARSQLNSCWTVLSYYAGQEAPYVTPDVQDREGNSNKSLYFYPGTGLQTQYVAFRGIESLDGLQCSFFAYVYNRVNTRIEVGIMSNPGDTNSFHLVESIQLAEANQWEYFEVPLSGVYGHYVALRARTLNYGDAIFVDDFGISVAPSCVRPMGLTVSSIGLTSVDIAIEDPSEGNHYRVVVTTDGDTVSTTDITTTEHTVSGLASGTYYTLGVATVCDDGTSTTPRTISFSTECVPIAEVPWTENFDGMEAFYTEDFSAALPIPCWEHLGSGFHTLYTSGYRYGNTGYSLMFHPGNTENSQSLMVLPPFNEPVSNLEVMLYTRPEGANSGSFDIGYITNTTDLSTFVAVEHATYSDFMLTSDLFEYRMMVASFPNAPEGARIALRHNGQSGNWYWYVDEVNVHLLPTCSRPTAVGVADFTQTTADIVVTDPGEAGTYHVVVLDMNGDTVANTTESSTTISVDGLVHSTAYKAIVSSVCESGEETAPVSCQFHTTCVAITHADLPYTEDFDSYTPGRGLPIHPCWTGIDRYNSTPLYPHPYNYVHNGSEGNSMCIYYGYMDGSIARTTYAVMPEVDSVSDLMVSLWYMSYNSGAVVEVGVMTDPSDPTTFTLVQALNCTGNNTFDEDEVFFDTYTGEGRYIAFRAGAQNGANYMDMYLDDITIGVAPSCHRPGGVSVTNASESEIAIAIDGDEAGTYRVYWTVGGATDSTDITGNTYTIAGLPEATACNIAVAAVCESGDVTTTRSCSATTTMTPTLLPFVSGFEMGEESGWMFVNGSNAWTIGTATSGEGSGAMYISNDGGTTNGYDINTSAVSYAMRTFSLDEAGQYIIRYSWKCYGESNWDYLRVWLAPATASVQPNLLPDGTTSPNNYIYTNPAGWTSLSNGAHWVSSAWNDVAETVNISTPGNYNIIFMWANDGSAGTQPPAAIDNFSIMSSSTPDVDYYHVSVLAVDAEGNVLGADAATVLGSGTYADGSTVSISVSAADGWQFDRWLDNNSTATSRSVTISCDTTFRALMHATVGIDQVAGSSLALVPNPATTHVVLSGVEQGARVTLVDMNGRTLRSLLANADELSIDLRGLAAGAYFVRVSGPRSTTVRKLVVR